MCSICVACCGSVLKQQYPRRQTGGIQIGCEVITAAFQALWSAHRVHRGL
jgi:hypothetical protein